MTQEQDIVERLQATASNLRRNLDNATFGGDDTFVRVKAPDLLMADLIEAAQTITALRAERDSWAGQAMREDDCRMMWQERAEAAEAKVKELEQHCTGWKDAIRERDEARETLRRCDCLAARLYQADLRRARSASSNREGGEPVDNGDGQP